MKRKTISLFMAALILIIGQIYICPDLAAAENPPVPVEQDPFETEDPEMSTAVAGQQISDPLEGYNRIIHSFNDKLYFYFLKPIARGYSFIVPKPARKCVKRVFYNAAMPGRFINCLLQGKLHGAGDELARFSINTTFGLGGIFSPAENCIPRHNEDSGQTLGTYGIGTGFYIVWPFLGPSSLRGTAGAAIDTALDPLTHIQLKLWERLSTRTYKIVNDTSLRLGEYEQLKKASVDPYIAFRNAYFQYRQNAVQR